MRRLADAGLTTREACGSSVRNITACPYSGVAADEAFDVTPYAEAMTRYLLRHPLSSTLPRKFKIAFEGCPVDHVAHGHQRHRLERAARQASTARPMQGFRVTVAGGTSTVCRAGLVLFEFLPASEILNVAEAIAACVPSAWRLSAQAAKPPEVPDQVARVGRLSARVRARVRKRPRGWRFVAAVRPGQSTRRRCRPRSRPSTPPPPFSIAARVATDTVARTWNPAQGRAASYK